MLFMMSITPDDSTEIVFSEEEKKLPFGVLIKKLLVLICHGMRQRETT